MTKYDKKVLYFFRRNLRLTDSNVLAAASQQHMIIPVCILDKKLPILADYAYNSHAQFFLREALIDLHKAIKQQGGHLAIMHGTTQEIIQKLIVGTKACAAYTHREYTPPGLLFTDLLADICLQNNITCHLYDDMLLHDPDAIQTNEGKPYTVFTPYYKKALLQPVDCIKTYTPLWSTSSCTGAIQVPSHDFDAILPKHSKHPEALTGTRSCAEDILASMGKFATYATTHDKPATNTTMLSSYIAYGIVSIREVYAAIEASIGLTSPIIRQLYWRDFFVSLAYHFPHALTGAFRKKYDALPWHTDKKLLQAWCDGKTGFPIVDAGMRQLNQTGFMHNRVRLIVGSFLVKDCHINWQQGEDYFARMLTDYDTAVNNGNWQWIASTGADAQQYIRIFNPWLQQKKYDPQCVYIKRWVPELHTIPPQQIHQWATYSGDSIGYPKPILDHAQEAQLTKSLYKKYV